MSDQLIMDSAVGEIAATSIEPERGFSEACHDFVDSLFGNDLFDDVQPDNQLLVNDYLPDNICRRHGCVERRAVDISGKTWPYCQGNHCTNVGAGFGAQRRSTYLHRKVVGNVPFYTPPPLKPGPSEQFIPPPINIFRQVFRSFDGKPREDTLAIERELENNFNDDPVSCIRILSELLKSVTPVNMLAPHKEVHPFCNSVDDELLPVKEPLPALHGERMCAREGCMHAAYIYPENPPKFGSYCSSRCYWGEVGTLNETRITSLDQDDIDYYRISTRFSSEIPSAKILRIFRLQMPRMFAQRYKTYRVCMAQISNTSMASITHRMFHGTKSFCSLLRLSTQGCGLCTQDCAMCGIARAGNQKRFSRRTGMRMWFASTPAISYRYCGDRTTKAMFVVDVVAPECADIVIVDKDEATLPRFLIVFQ